MLCSAFPDRGVVASGAIYEATLLAGLYTAQFSCTTDLNNSGESLGAAAYVLTPATQQNGDNVLNRVSCVSTDSCTGCMTSVVLGA